MKKILQYSMQAAILALFITAPLTSFAQANLVSYWEIVPKAGQEEAFEEAWKANVAIRAESETPRPWQIYTPVTGEALNVYVFRFCCFEWGGQDAYIAWNEGNSAVGDDWDENVHPHVESYAHYFAEIDLDNSHWPDDVSRFKYFGVTTWSLAPGGGVAYDSARDEISQIAINNGWATDDRFWGWSTRIGGSPQESIVVPYENYADMVPGEQSFFEFLTEHMGSAEAAGALFEKFSSAVSSSNYTIWAHDPDLSMSSGD
jgi:hypothetical protein